MSSGTYLSVLGVFSVITLCLVGGMAIIAFTKVVGIGALGTARTEGAAQAHEVSFVSRYTQWIAIGLALFVAVAPGSVLRMIWGTMHFLLGNHAPPESLLSTLDLVGKGQALLIVLITGMWLIRKVATKAKPLSTGLTWGCGFTEGDARVQYTATTYADSTVDVAGTLLGIQTSYRPIASADMFPHVRSYHTEEHDVVATKVLNPGSASLERFLRSLAVLQTGNLRMYLLYAFVFIIVVALLTLAGVL